MPGVLKGGAAGSPPVKGPTSSRVEAEVCQARARALLAEAERRAAALIADAEARAADADARAAALRAESMSAGLEAGRAEAGALLIAAAAARDRILAEAEEALPRLALAVAEKVIRRTLASERDAVCELAAAALAEARGRRVVRLRLHPGDLPAAAAQRSRLAALAGGPGLELLEDPTLAPGDAVVETEAGLADARVETQLGALRRALLEVR